jgi:glycine/D-amino acid oxidase-like deaminating enzyme
MTASVSGGRDHTTDVTVIGNGIIGLAIGLELVARGLRCRVLGANRPGTASTAAAGILAPSVAQLPSAVRPFFFGSLEQFPRFLDRVREFDPTLSLIEGLLEIAADRQTENDLESGSVQLDGSALAAIEPALAHLPGAILHRTNSAIDNVRLLQALARAAASTVGIDVTADDAVLEVMVGDNVTVRTESGSEWRSATIVVAAGAWSGRIRGLPRPLPVSPLKGQMLALNRAPLHRSVMAPDVYLVPRGSETLVGATSEVAGFDVSNTESALSGLQSAAESLCPTLVGATRTRAWAGVRPATPDMLPILGGDPDYPSVVYAFGHSRNGILLAPATADVVGALVTGQGLSFDIVPFSVTRFDGLTP